MGPYELEKDSHARGIMVQLKIAPSSTLTTQRADFFEGQYGLGRYCVDVLLWLRVRGHLKRANLKETVD